MSTISWVGGAVLFQAAEGAKELHFASNQGVERKKAPEKALPHLK
jgi:hypothetical protein